MLQKSFTTAILYTAAVEAGLTQMQDTLKNIATNTTGLRSLTNNQLASYFMPYGCWCNFDSDKHNMAGRGRGKPMDDWDASCRVLQEGYECAAMDAEARGDDCEPWAVGYPSGGVWNIVNIRCW